MQKTVSSLLVISIGVVWLIPQLQAEPFADKGSSPMVEFQSSTLSSTAIAQSCPVSSTACVEDRKLLARELTLEEYPQNDNVMATASSSGGMASSMAKHDALLTQDPLDSSIIFSSTGSFSAEASGGPEESSDREAQSVSGAAFRLSFKVFEGPATLTMNAEFNLTASRGARAEAVFQYSNDFTPFDDRLELRPDNGTAETLTDTLTVEQSWQVESNTNDLFFSIQVVADNRFGQSSAEGASSAEGDYSCTFTISGGSVDDIVWIGGDGDFNDSSNWEPEKVPTGGDTVRFHDSDVSPIDVIFDASSERFSSQVTITDDTRFVGGVYTLGVGSETEPALAISPTSASSGFLVLDGHQLNTGFASVAQGFGGEGDISVFKEGFLFCLSRLTVGESGMGTLKIGEVGRGTVLASELRVAENAQSTGIVEVYDDEGNAVSEIQADTVSVGYFGKGTLNIMDAQIETGQTSIGRFFGSSGTVEIKGDEGTSVWTYGGELRVGDEGKGNLTITSGTLQSMVDNNISVGHTEGATGTITVQGAESFFGTLGRMDVGPQGHGRVLVKGGATVDVANILNIGGVGSDEEIDLVGVFEGIETATKLAHSNVKVEELRVGASGRGFLVVQERAYLKGKSAFVGTDDGGDGFIRIADRAYLEMSGDIVMGQADPPPAGLSGKAKLILEQKLNDYAILEASHIYLYNGASIEGTGIIKANSGIFFEGGLISTGTIAGEFEFKQDTALDPLRVEGDVSMTDGTIGIGVFDLGASEHGIIEVTGQADIQSATIHFVFQDGFLPKTDDEIPFFMAQGDLTVGILAFTYEGAGPGFQFDVMEQNGMLMFKALNDAQPEGGEPTPRPTAINPNTDINGDNIVDANDLLEVMRNWYHVVVE